MYTPSEREYEHILSHFVPMEVGHVPRHRYVTLHSSAIFESLVSLYTSLLVTQWQHLKTLAGAFAPPPGVSPHVYAARVYISHWFLDLYAPNRKAIKKISPIAFAQHFQHDSTHYSLEYDNYLTLLNADIRPTHIKGALDNAICIPLISDTIDWASDNPFSITHFAANYDYFMGIIGTMKDSMKNWKMSTLVKDAVGKPSWLFDWHDEACCTWFPAKGNYSREDVAIAYIIGEACSPNMGPRDVDDWTFFEEGMSHTNFDVNTLPRSNDRHFYGSYEVRTIEVRVSEYPEITYHNTTSSTSKKRKSPYGSVVIGAPEQADQSSASGTGEPSLALATVDQLKAAIKSNHQYQISDWTYHARVVLQIDPHSRSHALRTLVMG